MHAPGIVHHPSVPGILPFIYPKLHVSLLQESAEQECYLTEPADLDHRKSVFRFATKILNTSRHEWMRHCMQIKTTLGFLHVLKALFLCCQRMGQFIIKIALYLSCTWYRLVMSESELCLDIRTAVGQDKGVQDIKLDGY